MRPFKEHLLLSIFSYCNFSEEDYGKTLSSIYLSEENIKKIKDSNFYLYLDDNKKIFLDFFKDVMDQWEIFYVDNRTASVREKSSGFYGLVYKNGDRYILAYRGSEKYPVEDAYKDFVETDLSIGIGKRPKQFWEGFELYRKIHEDFAIAHENITITGHSLGGGIAQFTALLVAKEFSYIPNVYTWNSVGISREGIISLGDFIDYSKMLDKCNLTEEEKEIFLPFREDYLNFILKEIKNKSQNNKEKNQNLLTYKNFNLDDKIDVIKGFLKETPIEQYFSKIPPLRKQELISKNKILENLFAEDEIKQSIFEGIKFIKQIESNKIFEERVLNFCHSKDLTNFLFPHVGAVYQVDLNFLKRENRKKTFFHNLMCLTKSVQGYHFQDVFIPFIKMDINGDERINSRLSIDYIGTVVRKLTQFEYSLSKDFLASYYSLIDISEENYLKLKGDILKGLNSIGEDILYKNIAVEQIEEFNCKEMDLLWKSLRKKLPSPYKPQDIFDAMIFKNKL